MKRRTLLQGLPTTGYDNPGCGWCVLAAVVGAILGFAILWQDGRL